ncbi:MAG: hypothetical protein JRF33_08865 [Deltaproteobacteria bacterium]|nr:hypothetical protein [Deltaproteobacteria bacterium]
MGRFVISVGLLLFLSAMGIAQEQTPATDGKAADRWLPLQVKAREVLELRVPKHFPGLFGFVPSAHSVKLVEMADSGQRLKAGALWARFAFPEENLRMVVERRLKLVQSEALRDEAGMAEQIQKLAGRLALARIEAEKAGLNKQKKNVLSKRDSELVELAARRASFEVEALERRMTASTLLLGAVKDLGAERVRQAQMGLADLADAAAAYRLKLPKAGRLMDLQARSGERLRLGALAARLVIDRRLELVAEQPVLDARALSLGDRVILKRDDLGKLWQGEVKALRPLADSALQSIVIAPKKARLKSGQTWLLRLPPEQEGPFLPDIWLRAGLEGRKKTLYAPEWPRQSEMRLAWVAPLDAALKAGDVFMRFDPQPVAVDLRRARDREALAQVRLDKRLAAQGLERFELETEQTRRSLALERARLLALPGVGLRGALAEQGARLDREGAELALRQAHSAAEIFEMRAAAELEVDKIRLEFTIEAVEAARRNMEGLSMRVFAAGLLRCLDLQPGSRVQAGQSLCQFIPDAGEKP